MGLPSSLFFEREGKEGDAGGEGRVGESRVWCQLEEHPLPAGQIQTCTDGNVFTAKGPSSQGENPTSGEHLDQTAAMKAQHQTRVSKRPSPQALLQEKLQIFLLEAFKCHRNPQVWDRSLFTETDVPASRLALITPSGSECVTGSWLCWGLTWDLKL